MRHGHRLGGGHLAVGRSARAGGGRHAQGAAAARAAGARGAAARRPPPAAGRRGRERRHHPPASPRVLRGADLDRGSGGADRRPRHRRPRHRGRRTPALAGRGMTPGSGEVGHVRSPGDPGAVAPGGVGRRPGGGGPRRGGV
ncbi:MAG: hypothetical protein MZU84_00840 [Sphingobacterium sp.]|nr:hypothetical protein [Sphingobacterium sp.]